MEISLAKEKMNDALERVKASLSSDKIDIVTNVEVATNNVEDGSSQELYIFGSISIACKGISDEDILYLPLDAEIVDGEVDGEKLEADIAKFEEKIAEIKGRLENTENVAEEIKLIGKEIDDAIDAKFREELAKADELTRKNLKVAVIATVAMLVVAVVCVIIGNLI